MKSHYSENTRDAVAGSPRNYNAKSKVLLKKNYFPMPIGTHELLEFQGIPVKQDLPPINQRLKNAWMRICPTTDYNVELLRYMMLRTLDKLLFQGYLFAIRRQNNRIRCANALRASLYTYPAVRSPFCKDLSIPTGSTVNSTFKKVLQHFSVLEYFLDDTCYNSYICQLLLEFVSSIVSPRRKTRKKYATPQMKKVEQAIHGSCKRLVQDVAKDIDTDGIATSIGSSMGDSLKNAAPEIGRNVASAVKEEFFKNFSVTNLYSSATDTVGKILTKVIDLVQRVTEVVINDLKQTPLWITLLLCTGALAIVYYIAQSLSHAVAPYLIALCSWFGVDFKGKLPSWCSEPCAEAQSVQDVLMYAGLAISLVLGRNINMRSLGEVLRLKHYGGNMVDALFENFTKSLHFLAYEITGDERFKYVDQLNEVKEAIEDAGRLFLRRDIDRQIVKDKALGKEVARIHAQMQRLTPVVNVMKERGIATSFRAYQTKVANLYTMSIASSPLYNNRVEPVCLLFAGPPNQGKTTVARMITDIVYEYMHINCPDQYPKPLADVNLIYTKPQTSQYWEKYAGNFCTVLDEFYQSRNPDVLGSACVDLTQMISSGPFTLDSAAISGKGTNMFSSQMVTIMSNMTTDQFDRLAVSDPSALYRRFHFPLTVKRVKELKPGDNSLDSMVEAWEFSLTDHASKNVEKYTGMPQGLQPKEKYNIVQITKMVCEEMLRRHLSDPVSSWTSDSDNRSAFLAMMSESQMFSIWSSSDTTQSSGDKAQNGKNFDPKDGKDKRVPEDDDSSSESIDESEISSESVDESEVPSIWLDFSDLSAAFVNTLMEFRFSNQVTSIEKAQNIAKSILKLYEGATDEYKLEAKIRLRFMIVQWAGIAALNDTYTGIMLEKFLFSGDWRWLTNTVYLQHSLLTVFQEEGLIDMALELEDLAEIPQLTLKVGRNVINTESCFVTCNTFLRVREDPTRLVLIHQLRDLGYIPESRYNSIKQMEDAQRRQMSLPYQFSFFEAITCVIGGVWDTLVKLMCWPLGYWTNEGFDGVDPQTAVRVATVFTGFYIGYRATKYIWNTIVDGCEKIANLFAAEINPEAQLKYERCPRYLGGVTRRTNRSMRSQYMRTAAHAQAGAKTVNIGQRIAKNIFDVTFHCGTHSQVGKIFFICETYAVCAGHAVTVLGYPQSITLQYGTKGGNVTVGSHQYTIRHIAERDLAIIEFSRSAVQLKTRLTNYLISRDQFEDLHKEKCVRVHAWSNQNRAISLQNCGEVNAIDVPFQSSTVVDGQVQYIPYDNYYSVYEGRGQKGDCGLPYISDGEVKILGIHIASFNRDGIVAPIFAEDFDPKMLAKAQTMIIPNYLPTPTKPEKRTRDGTIPLGTLAKGVGAPSRNDLEPTILNERGIPGTSSYRKAIYDINVEPARVSREEGYDPWTKANSDYTKTSTPPMPPLMYNLLKNNPTTLWAGFAHEHEPSHVCKRLSIEVAIFGDESIGSMSSSSSPGLYGLYNGLKRKDYFNLDNKTIDDKFKKRVEILSQIARSGDVPVIDCLENLKVELRTIGKYPRMFSAVGVEHVTWTKMVLGDLNSHLKKHHLSCASAIGVNPHNPEWDVLGRRVLQQGFERIGGDFSGCDVTVPHYVWYAMFKFANSYYCYPKGSDDYKELKACCRSVSCMYRIRGNEAFLLQRGHPSGHYMTSVWNSLWGFIMYRYIFIELYPNATVGEWYNAVKMIVYGDDNIGCVFAEKFPLFNMVNIATIIREKFGMIYTMPDKSEVTEPYLQDDEPEFLSRGFVKEGIFYRAPLKLDSIYGMLLFTHKSDELSAEDQLKTNLRAAEMELFQHGKDAYNYHTAHISEACKERGLNYQPKKYSYWLGWYASFGDNNRVIGYPERESL